MRAMMMCRRRFEDGKGSERDMDGGRVVNVGMLRKRTWVLLRI
jgi:hypothetical protein